MIFREVEDRDLIARAKQGHVDAYNVLVSRWEKRVFNYLLLLIIKRETAQDLSQDVLLKAWQNLRKLEEADKFPSWLFRIAHNEAYSLLRKTRPEEEIVSEPLSGDRMARLYPVETALAVRTALTHLSTEQREAVVLKIYEGFKFEEMAQILDIPLSTVKSRLYSALEILKDALAPLESRRSASTDAERRGTGSF